MVIAPPSAAPNTNRIKLKIHRCVDQAAATPTTSCITMDSINGHLRPHLCKIYENTSSRMNLVHRLKGHTCLKLCHTQSIHQLFQADIWPLIEPPNQHDRKPDSIRWLSYVEIAIPYNCTQDIWDHTSESTNQHIQMNRNTSERCRHPTPMSRVFAKRKVSHRCEIAICQRLQLYSPRNSIGICFVRHSNPHDSLTAKI